MKRFILLIALITTLFSLSGSNNQKIYPIDSDIYQAITSLYLSSGYALPSTSGPYSKDELLKLLKKVEHTSNKELYNYVYTSLNEKEKPLLFGLEASLEAYVHTDNVNFTDVFDWIRSTNDRNSLLTITMENYLLDNFYGYFSFPFDARRYNLIGENDRHTSSYYGKEYFTSNLFFLYGQGFGDIDLGMPYRAFVSFGSSGWSAQIGRDRLSWGPGVTGNLTVGEHLRYHNTARIALFSDNFKYTFATSFFAHPQDYYPILDEDGNFSHFNQNIKMNGINMFMAHRLEGRLFKDKVGIALTESVMYQHQDGTIDFRILSPAMLFHNYYIRSNANSLLSLEVDYTPIKNWNIYAQVAIDEFTLPGEGSVAEGSKEDPPAMGFMVGVKSASPVKKGTFYGSFEVVQTDPFLYLRDSGDRTQDLNKWPISFVVANREYSGPGYSQGLTFVEEFLGYKYGPDALVFNLNGGYKEFEKWYLEGNLFYMLHGTHDKWTLWSQVASSGSGNTPPYSLSTPTDKHWSENFGDLEYFKRDSVSRSFVATLKGGYTIIKNLNSYAQVDFINIVNPKNISSNLPIRDFQFTFGISYSL